LGEDVSGPWEKYGAVPAQDGPWSKYQEPETEPVKQNVPSFAETVTEDYKKAPWLDRQMMALATGPSNLVQGAKQLFGKEDQSQIAANRAIAKENPVASTIGNIATIAPAALIPGVNTMAGAALLGGASGLLQPTQGDESRAVNTAVGAGFGMGGKVIGDKIAQGVNTLRSNLASQQSRNAIKDATLAEAKAAGYVLPKSDVAPTFLNNRLEGIAGKAALKQEATLRNQEVTNSLARKAIGLPDDQPLSEAAIEAFKARVAEPYRQVAALDKRAAAALEKLKDVRSEAKVYWNHYNRSATPESLRKAKSLDGNAEMLERVIDSIAGKAGKPELLGSLREARKRIAQAYDVERALNPATGDINANVLKRLVEKGKPISDELATIGKFAAAHPKFAGAGPSTPASGVGKTEALAAAALGMGGGAALGPAGLLAAGLPLMSAPTRNVLLSGPYQQLVRPNYSPGMGALAAEGVAPFLPGILAGAANSR
jgi:hypothetical protein